ncbi:argininosuccinate lyase [Alicyclobacillus mengziensis]|uniref:Argininosuccinate lyase n=1 Tax=Alicyclobacillus mengziensis TaxID=2931921 RepID=A0A9X7W293_9BACL|nr:argininosuccinate lyase [Alicyclobacillus mengziensis]QSO49438.1 argininosuccinate lyase [Alicyclobacillus mengziensis]
MKLWGGRFTEELNQLALEYTASIGFDYRLFPFDVEGSMAHARMLEQAGIVTSTEAEQLLSGLSGLRADYEAGNLSFSIDDEDVHMNVERLLSNRIGAVAGKLHTARSRNDQVALDMHLFVKYAIDEVSAAVRGLQSALVETAEKNMDVIVPGYTHLQRAQPILFSHHLLAYFWMLERDWGRLADAKKRTDWMPLGAGALAGTTFPIQREFVQEQLGFAALYENSLDAVSDRDYLIEFMSAVGTLMMHLSRFSEEMILWSSEEFGWIELADAYCTGSSMMPQKKNPDVAEVVRGKTGRVYGHLLGLLTVLKGLPLAYNKDLQEDKEGVFDAFDTVLPALKLFTGMIRTLSIREEKLAQAFHHDFSNATDLADYLAAKGMPFREAHAVVGRLVLEATERRTNLAGLPLDVYQSESLLFDEDIYAKLAPQSVVAARAARGGTAPSAVSAQLRMAKQILTEVSSTGTD